MQENFGLIFRTLLNGPFSLHALMGRFPCRKLSGKQPIIHSVHTRSIVKKRGFTRGGFVKIGEFIKFKGCLVESVQNRRSLENQNPPKNCQKSGFF